MSSADNYCYIIAPQKTSKIKKLFEWFLQLKNSNLRIDGLKLLETLQGLLPFWGRFIANEISLGHLN